MDSPRKLTVEIFRDAAAKNVSIDDAEAGIAMINKHAANLEIVGTRRLMKIADSTLDIINPYAIRWPKADANINIVLSGRSFRHGNEDAGETLRGVANPRAGFAVVNASANTTEFVVAHEGSHLLHVKNRGEFHEAGHCTCSNCILLPAYDSRKIESQKSVSRSIEDIQARLDQKLATLHSRYPGAQFSSKNFDLFRTVSKKKLDTLKPDFCRECKEHLAVNAFYLAMQNDGRSVPPGILY